jgi:ATP-dependent protease ClpP protease subunit
VRIPAAEEDDPKEEVIASREELMDLRAEKLREEIRFETARAQIAEIEAKQMVDKEADRLAKPGARKNLQLNIFDVISGHNVDQWIDVLEHWERRDPGAPITIRINSPGGSVFDGLALHDTILRLRRKGHRVTTHGTGMIASMASVLMQAGDERVLDKNAWFMVHEVASGASLGDLFNTRKTSEQAEQVKLMKRLEDRLLDILSERSTLTKAQIKRRWTKTDDWMTAEQTLELGYVDRVE